MYPCVVCNTVTLTYMRSITLYKLYNTMGVWPGPPLVLDHRSVLIYESADRICSKTLPEYFKDV